MLSATWVTGIGLVQGYHGDNGMTEEDAPATEPDVQITNKTCVFPTTLDLRMPPNAALRRRYKDLEVEQRRLYEQRRAATQELRTARDKAHKAIYQEQQHLLNAVDAEFLPQIAAVELPFDEKMETLDEQMLPLVDEIGAGDRLLNADYTDIVDCALTGLPVFASDDVFRDEETGDVILRAALPWPEPDNA